LFESLLARAQWTCIRREARRDQQRRVGHSPECHTRAFVEVLLGDVGAAGPRDTPEFVASLALAAVEAMGERETVKHDLRARIWAEVANARRIRTEWSRALAALRRADEHLPQGSGDLFLQARVRSIAASLQADEGHRSEAMAVLEHSKDLYESLQAWHLVARTLIKEAHVLVDTEPERGLSLIDKALPMIPAGDTVLRWLAESLRTECLIEMKEVGPALQAFHLAEVLRTGSPRPDAVRRSDFTAARLLEALGHFKEAERLFDGVIADAFEHEAYREAFLDLLYLFGLHIRRGETGRAAGLCRFAVSQLERLEVGHEQLRTVWKELLEATKRQEVAPEALAEAREIFRITPALALR
jgi:tetratricopeptide (TPR) repeat protein